MKLETRILLTKNKIHLRCVLPPITKTVYRIKENFLSPSSLAPLINAPMAPR